MQGYGAVHADVGLHVVQDVEQVDVHGNHFVFAEIAEECVDLFHGGLDVAVIGRGPENGW